MHQQVLESVVLGEDIVYMMRAGEGSHVGSDAASLNRIAEAV